MRTHERLLGTLTILLTLAIVAAIGSGVQTQQAPATDLGYTDTAMLPGVPYRVHDRARPHPPVVTPGADPGAPPSDAVVLFDGGDLSKWAHRDKQGAPADPKWALRDGYVEVAPGTGSLVTREDFGDIQLHIEWAAPAELTGNSQGRGNSGVFLMGLYEVQVLDSFDNPSYADGQAGALYGQWPPLVNAARRPAEWQTYDIVFEAPRFDGGKLVTPASMTVFWNGIIVHNRQTVIGRTAHRAVARYTPHPPELPIMLQDHGNPVRFRNMWVRRLSGYDAAPAK